MKCNVCGAQIVRKEREVMNGFVIFKVECPKCGAHIDLPPEEQVKMVLK